ncbi:MAG: hypothetical protein AAGM33_09460 [Pseudomonadota bacterium]
MTLRLLWFVFLAALVTDAAEAKWLVAKSPNFIIYSEEEEDGLRKRSRELEIFHKMLVAITGSKSAKNPYPVTIYFPRDIDDIQKIAGRGTAGFYTIMQGEPVAIAPRKTFAETYDFTGDLVLRHEYAHHFMFQYFPGAYPGWYEEGFAELVSTFKLDDSGDVLFGLPADHRAYGFSTIEWIPNSALMTKERGDLASHYYDNYYSQSWVTVHFLTMSPKWRPKLADYLARINAGQSFQQASLAFGSNLRVLDKAIQSYVKNKKYPYRRLSGLTLEDKAIDIRPVPADEAQILDLKMDYLKYIPERRARFYIGRLRKQVAKVQPNAPALLLLAKAEQRFGNHDETIAAADKLLAMSPDHQRAHYWKGMGLLGKAQKAEEPEKKALTKSSRLAIGKANRLAPEDPLPLRAYFHSYKVMEQSPPTLVEDALWQAHRTVPQDDTTRRMLVEHLVEKGNRETALQLLKPLVYAAHRRQTRSWAKELYKTLRSADGTENDPDTSS